MAALLGFAIAFLVDAALVNHTYDSLRSNHVAVKAESAACYFQPIPRRSPQMGPPNMCQLRFSYDERTYTALVGINQPRYLFVDPSNPTIQMTRGRYEDGAANITGDLVIGAGFLLAAGAVVVVHRRHIAGRLRTRPSVGTPHDGGRRHR